MEIFRIKILIVNHQEGIIIFQNKSQIKPLFYTIYKNSQKIKITNKKNIRKAFYKSENTKKKTIKRNIAKMKTKKKKKKKDYVIYLSTRNYFFSKWENKSEKEPGENTWNIYKRNKGVV